MIGYLRGEVLFRDSNYLVLDVKGVGYKVVGASDVLAKGVKGTSLELFIYTHVREDVLQLFGFLDTLDLKLFENLIGVSGIGPKTAMAIFSAGKRNAIVDAIVRADIDFFTSVPRLGRKNAQKIIIELKNKFGSISELDLNGEDMSENKDTIAALKNFGFTTREIYNAIKQVKKDGQKATETIKLALKYLGK